MMEWLSGENRVRLFLGLLLLVLVILNSQSLQVSHQARGLLEQAFRETVQARAGEVASHVAPWLPADLDRLRLLHLAPNFDELARKEELLSVCLLDWNGLFLSGSKGCRPSGVRAYDRLDRRGKLDLLENGWAVTEVAPTYDPGRASAYGYRVVALPDGLSQTILRVEVPASGPATANRSFRSTLLYQVSAFALVLLTLVLFLKSLLAPHRRLVAEARSVAGSIGRDVEGQGESQFLLSTFQAVVAQLKQKERELAEMHRHEKARADETEALATDIIRSMTTGLVSLDESSRVVLVNPAAEKVFRLEASSAFGKPFPEVFPGSPELAAWVEAALSRAEMTLRRRVDYRRADGAAIHLGVSVIPLFATNGNVRGALCLHADLTEVIQLRERLFLKENLARLGEMAAGIAHEFRNSLATILGNANLLKRAMGTTEITELVDSLVDESNALGHVVTEFLQFVRPEALRLAPLDLACLAVELSEELDARAREAGVRLSVEATPCLVEADEVLIRKALTNLVLNSIEAAGAAGPDRGAAVRIETVLEGTSGLARVSDNGPGIPEADMGRIFTPFFTTKPGGTGLGLALVQKIAVAHNGEVLVESREGSGATFTLRLPVRAEPAAISVEWV